MIIDMQRDFVLPGGFGEKLGNDTSLLLAAVEPVHALLAVSACIMSATVIAGLVYRPRGRVLGTVGWVSILLFCMYVMNVLVVFFSSASP